MVERWSSVENKTSNADAIADVGFDVCVVGAGTAGTVAALSAAAKGAKVALIDSKPRALIGRKVCGDTLSVAIVDRVRERLGVQLVAESLERRLTGVEIFVHGIDYSIVGDVDFFSVDRHKFGQELVEASQNAGVEIFDNCRFSEPIVTNGTVSGVRAYQNGLGPFEFHSAVTIDATGFPGVLTRSVLRHNESIPVDDMWTCYREIRQLTKETDTFSYMTYYFDQSRAPGGIMWTFPRSETKVNTGVCLPPLAPIKPKDSFSQFVKNTAYFDNSITLESAGAPEPVRRPLDTMVGPGMMAVGDAACQASPINGGGIDFSIYAADIAGTVAAEAASKGDASLAGLWSYNTEFMSTLGKEIALHDVFRHFLCGLTNAEFATILRRGLLNEHEFLHLVVGGMYSVSLISKLARAILYLSEIPLYSRAVKTMWIARQIFNLYKNFPNPKDFERWRLTVSSLFDKLPRIVASR